MIEWKRTLAALEQMCGWSGVLACINWEGGDP